MGKAKDILLKPTSKKEADAIIKKVHYSGKTCNNSQINIGCYYKGNLEGAMQFGSPLDKSKVIGLVKDTAWNNFIELNRLAFTDVIPRNGESRALSVALRLLKQHTPHIEWVLSYSDASQCGDGTIYRASGFVLTGINDKSELWQLPEKLQHLSKGSPVVHRLTVQTKTSLISNWVANQYRTCNISLRKLQADHGGVLITGAQMRYIYFMNESVRKRLTVPEIEFSQIKERGLQMYKGKRYNNNADVV